MASLMLSMLQVYRGLAAQLVVLFHASGIVLAYWGESSWLHAFDFGTAGVQFFFVLSGFIIYYIHHQDVGTGNALPYLEKRIVRVYPVYIVVMLVLAPFWLLIPSFGLQYHKSVSGLVMSMLLIPQSHYPHLVVAWTLIHEMIFYLIFATLILSRLAGRIALMLWFAAIVVANLLLSAELSFTASYLLSVNNLLFGFGMLAAYAVLHRPRKRATATFIFGNALFLATGAAWNSLPGLSSAGRAVLILAFGLASFIIVLHAAQPNLDALCKRQKVLLLLGDASYSIYLIHYPAMSAACKLLAVLGVAPPKLLAFAAVVVFGTVAGIALHLLVEKPLLAFFRARLAARSWKLGRAGAQ